MTRRKMGPCVIAAASPCGERFDGLSLRPFGTAIIALPVLVGLRLADVEHDSVWRALDVGKCERDELAAAQRRGEADQDQRLVALARKVIGNVLDELRHDRRRAGASPFCAVPSLRRMPRMTALTLSLIGGSKLASL